MSAIKCSLLDLFMPVGCWEGKHEKEHSTKEIHNRESVRWSFLKTFIEIQQPFCDAVLQRGVVGKGSSEFGVESRTYTSIFTGTSNYFLIYDLFSIWSKSKFFKHILQDKNNKVLKASMRSIGKVYVST